MKFSVVLTTTRPHLLKDLMRVASALSHDDFEIVVSDNSKEGSEELVRSFNNSRVRYVRPEGAMRVAAHWDFAFGHARGDWVLQLCDDDAITPNILTILDRQINEHPDVQAICWNYGVYRRSDHWNRKSQIGIGSYTGKTTEYDAKMLLAEMFDSGSGLFRIKAKDSVLSAQRHPARYPGCHSRPPGRLVSSLLPDDVGRRGGLEFR